MLRKKDALFSLNSPKVIEERNTRIAEWIGKKLGYGNEKTRDMRNKITVLTKDSAPQKLLEYLYETLYAAKPGISREEIQEAIKACHEEAFGWLQNTYQNSRDN